MPRSTGLGAVSSPPFFSPHAGGVEDGTGQIQKADGVEPMQDLPVRPAQTPALDQNRHLRWAADLDLPEQGGKDR